MKRFPWIVVLCLLAFAAFAGAQTGPSSFKMDQNEVFLTPAGHYSGSLDDPQPDTLRYDDGIVSGFYPTTNMWGRVRFTAPNNFELRSIYFVTNNPTGNQAPCSLFVYSSVGGNLGTLLGSARVVGVLPIGSSLTNPDWNDVNLTAPVTLTAGQDFFIVIGPQPGGSQAQGWHILTDAGTTTNRSGNSTTRLGTYGTTSDWLIRAGGAAEPFVDLVAEECYDQNTAGVPKFELLSGDTINLSGQIFNNGNVAVPTFSVTWTVKNPSGTIVFTNTVNGGPLARNARAQFTASESFTPIDDGEYMAKCLVTAPGDAIVANDSTFLRFFVGPLHRWFRYDDNETDAYTSFTPGNGWGVTFRPVTFTAALESLRVNVNTAVAANASIAVWANDASGTPVDSVWGATPLWDAGWHSIAINPPLQFFEGESFTVSFLYTSLSLGSDTDPPTAAAISHMGTTSWQYEAGTWSEDNAGNWSIQAYLDTSSALPAWPLIATSLDTLKFGQVIAAGTADTTLSLWIYNRGAEQPLTYSCPPTNITPLTISPAFSIVPATGTVETGDSVEVQFTFNPFAVRLYNGVLVVNNNSHNASPKNIILRGEGIVDLATEVPNNTLPKSFALEQNFPNPFNPTTDIHFALPNSVKVRLAVYNVLGQEIALLVNETLSAGTYKQTFDATNLPAGIYFYRLEAGSFSDIRKMMLLK